MKIQKGQYGFLSKTKKINITKIIGCILIGLIMYIVGLLMNKGDAKNVCTCLAILMALPMAKAATELIVIFPFKDVEKSRFDKVKSYCDESATLMTGLVITSEKKVMNLDFLVEWEGNVIALAGSKEKDVSYVNEYLTKGVRNWGASYRIKVMKEEKAFLDTLKSMKPHETSEVEKEHVISYLKSLIVQ